MKIWGKLFLLKSNSCLVSKEMMKLLIEHRNQFSFKIRASKRSNLLEEEQI